MDPFTRLPNEIIDAIFIHLPPHEVWKTQQCSASTERALDPHMRTRRHAIDSLMWWACEIGNNQAVRKAVSLGADVSVLRALPDHPFGFPTVFCASYHLETVGLLFDLGARFDIEVEGFTTEMRESAESNSRTDFFQLCSDRGVTDQFFDFQDLIDWRLFEKFRFGGYWESEKCDDSINEISLLLELGASSVTLSPAWDEPPETALSCFIRSLNYHHSHGPRAFQLLKLLLSKRPDLNAPSLEMTRRFLTVPDLSISWEALVCPIASAAACMAESGTTEVMDMLLEAGAKLDLPVHACYQPLASYAHTLWDQNGLFYEYLVSHGASFEHVWHPGESVLPRDSTPIFRLFRDWRGLRDLFESNLLLDDGIFGIIKTFIDRGAVKRVGLLFINDVLRPITDQKVDNDKRPAVVERSHILLKLILREDNLDPNMPGEIRHLLTKIVDPAIDNAKGLEKFMHFNNIIDPIIVAMLLQKGARLEARSRTKEARDHVVSQLQRDPYNISFDI